MSTMTKKKESHKVPRVPFQLPKPFALLARKLAKKKQQPTTWFILKLIADAAKEDGEECPPLPWEEDIEDK